MATYTSQSMWGAGVLGEAIAGPKTFTIENYLSVEWDDLPETKSVYGGAYLTFEATGSTGNFNEAPNPLPSNLMGQFPNNAFAGAFCYTGSDYVRDNGKIISGSVVSGSYAGLPSDASVGGINSTKVYNWSIAIPGNGSFIFKPAVSIGADSYKIKSTGRFDLTIT